jgi:hypothetical protein
MPKLRPWALGLLLASGLAASLGATTLVRMSEQEMASKADLIVRGTCTHLESARLDHHLVTMVTVSVGDTLKGAPGGSVTVVVPGGVDLNRPIPIAETWPGAPRFADHQEVFLFLTRRPDVAGGYSVMGYSQGAFAVVSAADGSKMVERNLTGMSLADHEGVVAGGRSAVPLTDFERQVRSLVSAGAKGQEVKR